MITINANYNKKVPGEQEYSSEGYSCSITAEVDDSSLKEPERLQHKLEYLYRQCADAVEKQINGTSATPEQGPSQDRLPAKNKPRSSRNRGSSAQPMSDRQRSYIRDLASEAKLDSKQLNALCDQMFNSAFDSLSKLDASSLLSTLKDVQSGKITVASL